MSQDPFVVVKAGAAAFSEGEAGSTMFIIESGTIDIVRAERGAEPMATLEAGDFFGEMAMLEDQPRFASAIARTDCRLLQIERAQFADVLRTNVEIAVRIMRKQTNRLRRAEQRAQEARAALDEFKRKLSSRSASPAPAAVQAPAAPAPAPPPRPAPAPVAAAPAPVVAAAPLTPVLRHLASGQAFALTGQGEFLVGRPDPVTGINPEINLGPLDASRNLSRRHAKVVVDAQGVKVREEVGTANGTFVNGERIQTGVTVPLRVGDVVRFGSIEVVLEDG